MKPRSISTHTVSRATLLATSLGLAVVGHAAETTITKADNADALNLTTSWSGGTAPGASDIALWNNTVTAANAPLLGGDLSWAGIRIADPGGVVSIGAGNTLTLGGSGIDMSLASQNLSLANALAIGAAQTWNVSVGQTLTVSGAMSGSGGIAKAGPGTLVLGGGNASYSGAVAINDGTVQLNSAAALGATNAITLGATGGVDPTLIIGVGGVSHNLGAVNVPLTVSGAKISMPQNSSTFSHTIAGATLLSPLTVAQSNTSGNNWSQVTWTSKITGNGGGAGNDTLVFTNTGGTQNYFTTNAGVIHDFSGNVHVTAGLIAVQTGTANGNLVIPDTSMLIVDAPGNWRWNTGGMVETLDGLAGAGTISNPQNSTLTINANNGANDGNRSFSGNLGNMGGTLTLGGSGTQEFSGNNVTFTNATNLNNGTLKLTKTGGWGSSIAMGASNSPKVQLNAPLAADSWDFKKVVSGGSASASVEKIGDGTVTVTASQTQSGATLVSAGTLKIQSVDYPTAMPSIPGMRVWLDAADPEGDGNTTVPTEGAGISTWKNKGTLGATADFAASTSGTNPPTYTSSIAAFNNKPAITFNAATGKMLANTVNYSNTVSVVYVGRIGATKQRLVSGGTTNWILGYHGGNMGANYWNGGALGSAADTNPHIWINGATGGSNAKGYRFDGAGETALGDGTGGAGPTTGLTLGGGWNVTTTPTEKSDGDIAELFVFDHQLTTTERAQLEGYLYSKYFGSQFPASITSLNATGSVGVASGTSFGGYGSAGSTTVAAGGSLLAGNAGTGALTLGSVTFSGAGSVSGTPTTTAAPLVVNGALTTAGANTVSLAVSSSLGVGTYHMIQYGSLNGSVGAFKFPAPSRSMSIANNAPYIDVVVSPVTAFPVWAGTGSGEWSYNTGLGNWKLSTNSSATDFMANDAVLFDDTVGAGATAISVGTSNISPGVITFNNSSKNYTLTQANGMDINTGSLVKTGSGTLTISGSFTFAGGSSLNGGVVSVDSPNSLGTGGGSFNGGSLVYTGATGTMAGTTTLNAGGGTVNVTTADTTLTFGGALTTGGTGPLTKQGDGAFVLSLGTGTYSNAIAINGGTLGLNYGTNGAILTGNITGGSSGVLRLDGAGASATSGLTLSGNNTFSGETQIFTGRRIFLDSPVGNAISGDIVVKQGEYPVHGISLLRDEQIANTSALRFEGLSARYDFRLNGKTETLAGLVCENGMGRIGNAGSDGGADAGITTPGTLVVSGSGVYSYNGNLLDQSTTGNAALNFTKSGTGTQTLTGTLAQTGIVYTGATTVNSGILELLDTTGFASPVTVNGGTLKLNRSSGTWTVAVPISGAGGLEKAGVGDVVLSGAKTYTGPTVITDGSLSFTGTSTTPSIDVQSAGALKSTTVGTGTTVMGNGALVGVTFGSGSTLSPGSTGTPIVTPMLGDGTITFAAGSTCAMNVDRTGGVITSDRVDGADAIVYGGTLTVTATGQAFLAGNVVSLFPNATSYGGGFTTTNLPVLGAGLSWDLSKLTVDGSIQVVSATPAPVFNPPAGGYIGAQTITISSSSGSTIYYTLDGSEPTTLSPNGPSPITNITIPTNSNVTVKAFAKKAPQANSPVITSVYHTLDLPVWTLDSSGSWQDPANWQGGVLAQGNGVIANFGTLTTGGLNEVFLDGPRTVGQLIFGDQGNQYGWTLSTGTSGSLTLNNGASSPVVDVINQTATISAPVASGNGLVKTGPGTLVLNDVNSISGNLAVLQGTLEAGNAGAFGAAANAVTLGDASTGANPVELSFGSGVASVVNLASITNSNFGVSQQITLNAGSGLGANAAAMVTSLNLNGSVPVTLKGLNTGGHSTAQDVNWRITGTGIPAGATALVLDGSAYSVRTSQLSNTSVASDFTGDVLIKGFVTTQGRTYLTNTAENQNLNFLHNTMTVESGGTWNIVWGGETAGALNGGGNVVLNCQSALNNIGLTLGNNNVAGTHTGVISGGFALSKVGTGNQTLGGANTYGGGTTVNAGTLTLTNSTGSGTGTGAVTVKSGATLAGTGIASNTTTVETGGTVAPGTSGTGTLTLATASMAGTYQCQLDGANGDAVTVSGTLTIQPGATINVSTLGTPTAASYTILTYTTLTGTLPTITGVPSGYTVDTSTTGQVKLVGGNPFDSWINGFASLTNPADKTATADPDNDGLANIVEFVLNGDPANNAITNRPTLTASGANLVFTYTRRDDSESLAQAVEFDADIAGTWTTAVDGSNCTIVVTENGTNPDTVTVTIPKGANTKLFARLKVTP